MLYPLYEYYKNSDLNLDGIVDHYVTRFYSKKHDGEKVLKVLSKVRESAKIKNLFGQSATRRIAPNYIDFASVINEIFWFAFKSNMTQALGVLFAIMYWDEKINKVYSLKADNEIRDDAIKIFKKFSIYEEIDDDEFLHHIKSESQILNKKNEGEDAIEEAVTSKPNNRTVWDDAVDENDDIIQTIEDNDYCKNENKSNDNSREPKASFNKNEEQSTEVTDDDLSPAWIDEYGVKYSKDKKRLLHAHENLQDYSIQQGTLIIDNDAFKDCICLKRVFIPDSVNVICNSVFDGCVNLQSVILPPKVSFWGVGIFNNCKSLQYISIPEGVKSINTATFSFCKSLNNVLINDDSTEIGDYAFFECESLSSITIPKCVTSIGTRSFCYCRSLTCVKIPDSVTFIGEEAFYGCKGLTSIYLSHCTLEIVKSAFEGLEGLKNIYIPIGTKRKFEELLPDLKDKLVEMLVKDDVSEDHFSSGQFFDYDESLKKHALTIMMLRPGIEFLYYTPKDSSPLWMYNGDIYCDQDNSFIGVSAFVWIVQHYEQREEFCFLLDLLDEQISHRWVESLNEPEELINDIKKYIPSFKLGNDPQKVKTLVGWAWIDLQAILHFIDFCTNSINQLPVSTRVVHQLQDCVSTEELARLFLSDFGVSHKINNSDINDISDKHLTHNKNEITAEQREENVKRKLAELNANSQEQSQTNQNPKEELSTACSEEDYANSWIDDYGVKYSADKRKLLYAHEYVKDYVIKDGTEIICDSAFLNIDYKGVDYDYIVENEMDIDDFAIYVSELTSIYIPSSVKTIGKDVFNYCTKLSAIYVPIGEKQRFIDMLPDYKDIITETEFPIPANEERRNVRIDEFGVEYSLDLTILLRVPKRLKKYSIPVGTKIIGSAAFSNCEKLKSAILPDSITEIGHYAFANCKSIFAFALPNGVKRIGNGVFMGCSELSSIRIPDLEAIESDIFQGCEKLNSVFVPIGEKYKYENLLWEHDVTIHEYDPNKLDDVETLDKILHGLVDEYGVLYDFEGKTLMSVSRDLTTYSIKPGTTGIKAEAFNPILLNLDGTSLKKLYLPDSIQFIGEGAFANNTGLEYINIPKYAILFHFGNPFAGCINLHNIKWGTVFYIKEGTLIYDKNRTVLIACLGWQYVDGIQNSWPLLAFAKTHGKMKTGTFSSVDKTTGEVRKFKSVVFVDPVDGKTIKCFVGFSSQLGEITDEEIIVRKNDLIIVQTCSDSYRLCQTGTDRIYPDKIVELPEGLESIVANAFYGNEYLEEISLPKSLKEIGKDAFKGCSNLKKIHVPQGTISKFKELLPEWRAIIYEDQDGDLPF